MVFTLAVRLDAYDLEFSWAWNEAERRVDLDQSADPPVIVEFLVGEKTNGSRHPREIVDNYIFDVKKFLGGKGKGCFGNGTKIVR